MLADVIVREAGAKGKGVFALRDFQPREFIFRRRHGKVVANHDIGSLSAEDQQHLCELDWETSAVLLPPGCYLNHACDPNAMRRGVNVYAWRAIRAGDEITIDYRLNAFDGEHWECRCGSPSCLGYVISSFFALDEARQRLYLPFAWRLTRSSTMPYPLSIPAAVGAQPAGVPHPPPARNGLAGYVCGPSSGLPLRSAISVAI